MEQEGVSGAVVVRKNHLGQEKSPYLLQHKDNPVHWFGYGEAAFELARKEDKIILVSVGYATCHWCHVMEHESFEDAEVARVMNENIIAIKVDREELPDVDKIYMTAAQTMGENGGWPLNVFVTPNLHPFFAGTYFPRKAWLETVVKLADAWKNQRPQVLELATKLHKRLSGENSVFKTMGALEISPSIFANAYKSSVSNEETEYGGFSYAPKFPPSMQIQTLLRIYRRTGEANALQMAENALQGMARGGMYDHLGGGFARYSTDTRWLIPHFEKMLYDNALLITAYLEAYQVTKKQVYADVARETCDYVLRVMQNEQEGGFYSAEDADSEGVEGKFYVWTIEQISSVLSKEEGDAFCALYGVTQTGNFEHNTNNLNLLGQKQEGKDLDWSVKQNPLIQSAHAKLHQEREKRIHPLSACQPYHLLLHYQTLTFSN
eukprot:TRINITY_DN4614_c0_g1_i3.p1 TRINITY_DN4614_c0_g1~~TRINITY_DN4614_c0_g1_i3.p1  ORF type:complete len:435 (-),score=74.86 TRINITY_DN4614_c0_g1_i3:715-2019(-)